MHTLLWVMDMNWIWVGLIVFSVVFAALSGNMEAVSLSLTDSAQRAIEALLGMCGAYVFWSGLLHVAQKAGLVEGLARLLRKVLTKLFPHSAHDSQVMGAVAMNLGADMLGLGNAATPFGVEAVKGMSRLSGGVENEDIQMFLVLNAATLQFFPTTVIALRSAAGAAQPSDIILATILCSAFSMAVGIGSARLFARLSRRRRGYR